MHFDFFGQDAGIFKQGTVSDLSQSCVSPWLTSAVSTANTMVVFIPQVFM
jgi:hypothetical protein